MRHCFYKLRCRDGAGTIAPGPTFSKHPLSKTLPASSKATFTSVSTGNGTITRKWKKDTGSGFVDIPGATLPDYTTPPLVVGDDGDIYIVEATDDDGTTLSDPATLTVTATTIAAAGTEDETLSVFTYTSTGSTATSPATLDSLTWVLTFADTGYPNDGRVITVNAVSLTDSPTVVSDVSGTPNARLTTGQLSGDGSSWSFTADASNDIVLVGGGITTTIAVEDTAANSAGPTGI